MDHSELSSLAKGGFSAVPPDRLATLADWCWDWCEETGRGAYCSMSVTLREIDAWWSHHGVAPVELHDLLDDLIKAHLPGILESNDHDAGRLARAFRKEVESCLIRPDKWPGVSAS